MYDCYNEAVRYLQGKYGTQEVVTGSPYRGAKKQGIGLTFKTPRTIKPNGDVIDKTSHDDKVIKCLLGQYHYGIQAKKELYFKLIDMGVMEDKENQLRFRHC